MKYTALLLLTLITSTVHSQTWITLGTPASDSTRTIYDISFIDEQTGWIAGEANIRKTTDGGITWTKQTPDGVTPNLSFMALHFRNADTGWAGGILGESTIYFTTNGGQTWSPGLAPAGNSISTGSYTWDFAFLPSGKGLAAGSRSMGRTTNGRQWSAQPLSPNFRTVDYADSLIAVAAGQKGEMMRTVDGGLTWTSLPSPTPAPLYQLRFTTHGVGWAVGAGGTLLRSTDRGAHWSLIPTGTDADLWTTFFFDSDTGYIAGEDGLIKKTTDGGTTWTRLPTGTSRTITRLYFLSPGVGWAAGSNGLVLKTAPGTGAPNGLAYEKRLTQYSVGVKELYPVSPSVSGALPMRYSVTPALPAGLRLDSKTGILEGTPTQLAETARYLVEVSNAHGVAHDTIQLSVVAPPTDFSYSHQGVSYRDGDTLILEALVPTTLQPSLTGFVDGYLHNRDLERYLKHPTYYPRIHPDSPPHDLFNGLEIHPYTGIISGKVPTSKTDSVLSFDIKAFNNSGAYSSIRLHISVLPSTGITIAPPEKSFYLRLDGMTFNLRAPRTASRARIMFFDAHGKHIGSALLTNATVDLDWDSKPLTRAGILIARISWMTPEGRILRTDTRTLPGML